MHGWRSPSPLRIVAWPAHRNRGVNPYNSLLALAIQAAGNTVAEFSPREVVFGKHDLWHIHWPDLVIDQDSLVRTGRRVAGFLLLLAVAKVRGIRVVWTVHNLRSHEQGRRLSQRMLAWIFIRSIDGYLSLSESARAAALTEYPRLRRVSGYITPHGHYRNVYACDLPREAARERLGVAPSRHVFLFFGQVRPYKNVTALIEAFRRLEGTEYRLIIAGKVRDGAYEAAVRAEAALDGRVACDLAGVPEAEVQVYMRAANVLVLPYDEILNSGAAILGLSFGVPILAPAKGSLVELKRLFGPHWVSLYEGELTAQELAHSIAAAAGAVEHGQQDLERGLAQLDWDRVADATIAAYRGILEGK